MNIRKALPQEAANLAKLEALQPMSAGWGEKGFETELVHNFSQIWCAANEKEIIGFVAFRQAAEFSEILNVAVSPSLLRQGIAQAIFTQVFEALKRLEVKDITLEVNCRNIPAISLYKKLGFIEAGRREKFYNQTDDAVLMKLKL